MANKLLRPCRYPGCSVLVPGGTCALHRPKSNRSPASQSWRWMYGTNAWKDLRTAQLLREPFCRACARKGIRTPATDVDHIQDHKGDWARFTDLDNLQSLCHRCHRRKTAAENLRRFRRWESP